MRRAGPVPLERLARARERGDGLGANARRLHLESNHHEDDHQGLSLTNFNSIIAGNNVGIALSGDGGTSSGQNLLFGNTTNYMGLAVDGPGYVKADPLFDTTTAPPGLEVGSPARGAADPTKGRATDFYGHARPATPDRGAVQM